MRAPLRPRRGQAVRGAQEARFVGFRGGHLAGDAAAEQNDRPVAGKPDLRQFRGEQQDGEALIGDLAQSA